ncbi:YbaK/EbsC family protein [Shimia ponticola]|uniref:YbaK/EbsC family protein n=1 Tax=Shimia ponticola TaxID=2582893 RepID=UPI0011BDD4ED|nr:YbaK/EbsC family protein [Shimia ponticola]
MSKSLKRVARALQELNLDVDIKEVSQARTAQEAADSLGCSVAQIANSIIFLGQRSGRVFLFLTSGANRVDADKAGSVAGEPLGKADAAIIRAQTGFAIGGVAPVGHLTPTLAWFDPHLLTFDLIYAAAGTPRHLFGLNPQKMLEISGAQPADFTAQSRLM